MNHSITPYNFISNKKSRATVAASFLPNGAVLATNSTGSLSRSHFNEIVTGITVKIRCSYDLILYLVKQKKANGGIVRYSVNCKTSTFNRLISRCKYGVGIGIYRVYLVLCNIKEIGKVGKAGVALNNFLCCLIYWY